MHLVNTQTERKINANQKGKINCVRMYLGVEWISQSCTINGSSFVPGVLEGSENCRLKYQTTLTKPNQVKPGSHSWMLWKRILKILTLSPTTTTNQLKQPLGKWSTKHSECGKWLSYQDSNGRFYAKETHEDTEWIVYKRTNTGTQLTSINTITEYNPSKHSIPVPIYMTARGKIYPELGAELKSSEVVAPLSIGPPESFERLVADQSVWIIDLLKFVQFTPDFTKYGTIDTTIDDILAEHDKEGS